MLRAQMAQLDSERDESREEWWSTPLYTDKQSHRLLNELRLYDHNRTEKKLGHLILRDGTV